MKKAIRLLMLLIVLIFTLACFSACNNEGIDYRIGFFDYILFGDNGVGESPYCTEVKILVRCEEELKAVWGEWNNSALNHEEESFNALSQKIREYDVLYFEDNALIVFCPYPYNHYDEPQVEKLIVDSNELVIIVSKKPLPIGNQSRSDIGECMVFLIEVNSADIQDINTITIEKKTRLL